MSAKHSIGDGGKYWRGVFPIFKYTSTVDMVSMVSFASVLSQADRCQSQQRSTHGYKTSTHTLLCL